MSDCTHRRRLTFRTIISPEDSATSLDDLIEFIDAAIEDTIASEGWSSEGPAIEVTIEEQTGKQWKVQENAF